MNILDEAGREKVVLFCQPVETVEVVARHLTQRFGQPPANIIGGQTESQRNEEIRRFRDPQGAQFIVSSRASGEGLNLQVSRRLVHLGVPWNPMDLEQRIGRVHRFGSRATILVDTVIVPETREAHAYQIARQKLKLIAEQLVDASQFETLFSRVMSLVPPEDLAAVLSTDPEASVAADTENRIASIVRVGFDKFNSLQRRYAEGARNVTALDPGTADWDDVRLFLKRTSGAEDGTPATIPAFSVVDDKVTTDSTPVQTLKIKGEEFVCDDTQGMPATNFDNKPLRRLGLNSPEVLERIRQDYSVSPSELVGAVRLTDRTLLPTGMLSPYLFFYATQPINFEKSTSSGIFISSFFPSGHFIDSSFVCVLLVFGTNVQRW